jgi:hypothetical protein
MGNRFDAFTKTLGRRFTERFHRVLPGLEMEQGRLLDPDMWPAPVL